MDNFRGEHHRARLLSARVILSEAKDLTDEGWITRNDNNVLLACERSLTSFGMT
jgi:hypothetical protein